MSGLGRFIIGFGIGLFALVVLGVLLSQGQPDQPTPPNGEDPPPVVEYQNESYQVPSVDLEPPPLPRPTNDAELRELLYENPIYQVDLAGPVRCEVGALPLSGSPQQLEDHMNAQVGCMMRVWGPALERAGWVPVRPSVTVYDRPVKSRCGDTSMKNASYCSADQQIYVATDVADILPSHLQSQPFMVDTVLAHEFGHAVQGRTGIVISGAIMEYMATKENKKDEQLQWSRRIEVQADCFAGLYLNAVAQSTSLDDQARGSVSGLAHAIGDDSLSGIPDIVHNHGLGRSRQLWMERGLGTNSINTCNTITAPAEEVR